MDKNWRRLARLSLIVLLIGFFCAVPIYAVWVGENYPLTYFGRILVFVLCALGLNLVLGYGGMASLGHAMYIGLGAYSVGILVEYGVFSGWIHLGVALVVTALIATLICWIALRTQGMAFIMITLAFAQLFYYVFVSLRGFGGDDGLSLSRVSEFGALTAQPLAVYLSIFSCVLLVLWFTRRVVNSRFGLVLRASREHEQRVASVGISPQPYRLVAYVLSAQICAVGGFFMANLSGFVSPSIMSWMVSAELMIMVLLGGVATIFGPMVGAVALLFLEDLVEVMTPHWPLVIGPLIVLMVMISRRGIWGALLDRKAPTFGEKQS